MWGIGGPFSDCLRSEIHDSKIDGMRRNYPGTYAVAESGRYTYFNIHSEEKQINGPKGKAGGIW
jgi:hypothetical protein